MIREPEVGPGFRGISPVLVVVVVVLQQHCHTCGVHLQRSIGRPSNGCGAEKTPLIVESESTGIANITRRIRTAIVYQV